MSKPGDGDLRSGAGLINGAYAFPSLKALRDDFDILYFLDLCAGIEAAVLYDTLHLTGFDRGALPILEPLAEAGVLYDLKPSASDPLAAARDIMARPRASALMQRLRQAAYIEADHVSVFGATFGAATGLLTDLAVEEDTGLTLVLPFQQAPIYLALPDVEGGRTLAYRRKLTLAAQYAELKDVVLGFRGEMAIHDLDRLALPPLASQILSQADTFDELGFRILQARERYEPLRKRFRALRELWAADDIAYGERYRAKASLDADMVRLAGEVRYVPTLIEPISDVETLAEALPALKAGEMGKGAKILAPLAKLFEAAGFRFRMRPLFSLMQYAQNTSLTDLATGARILFKHELNADDALRARTYAASVARYVPASSKGDPA